MRFTPKSERGRRKAANPYLEQSPRHRLVAGTAILALDRKRLAHDAAGIEALPVRCSWKRTRDRRRRIILDFDATDGPPYGHQEGRFFHGCSDCCVIDRSACSTVGICWQPSCAPRTSTQCGQHRFAREGWRGASRTVWSTCSGLPQQYARRIARRVAPSKVERPIWRRRASGTAPFPARKC